MVGTLGWPSTHDIVMGMAGVLRAWWRFFSYYRNNHDLVEDSVLSMIHERMPNPQNDEDDELYSPTLGGYFQTYSLSGRNQPMGNIIGDDVQ